MLAGLRFKGGIMSRRNSAGRRTLLLLAFLVLTVAWSFGARAATSARGLYTLIVSDGYTSQKVPVYEYKTGNKITIAPGKDARTLYVNRASKKITVRLSSTTDTARPSRSVPKRTQRSGRQQNPGKNIPQRSFLPRSSSRRSRPFRSAALQ